MFYPINLIDCSEYVLNLNFDATNTLQTSWQRDNKRLGMLQKQMTAFHFLFFIFFILHNIPTLLESGL